LILSGIAGLLVFIVVVEKNFRSFLNNFLFRGLFFDWFRFYWSLFVLLLFHFFIFIFTSFIIIFEFIFILRNLRNLV